MNRTIENEEGGNMELDIPSEELDPEEIFMKLQKVEMRNEQGKSDSKKRTYLGYYTASKLSGQA